MDNSDRHFEYVFPSKQALKTSDAHDVVNEVVPFLMELFSGNGNQSADIDIFYHDEHGNLVKLYFLPHVFKLYGMRSWTVHILGSNGFYLSMDRHEYDWSDHAKALELVKQELSEFLFQTFDSYFKTML